jgi:hypothetical protein
MSMAAGALSPRRRAIDPPASLSTGKSKWFSVAYARACGVAPPVATPRMRKLCLPWSAVMFAIARPAGAESSLDGLKKKPCYRCPMKSEAAMGWPSSVFPEKAGNGRSRRGEEAALALASVAFGAAADASAPAEDAAEGGSSPPSQPMARTTSRMRSRAARVRTAGSIARSAAAGGLRRSAARGPLASSVAPSRVPP